MNKWCETHASLFTAEQPDLHINHCVTLAELPKGTGKTKKSEVCYSKWKFKFLSFCSLQVHSSGVFWISCPSKMKRVKWFCSSCPTKTSPTRRRTRILRKDLTQVGSHTIHVASSGQSRNCCHQTCSCSGRRHRLGMRKTQDLEAKEVEANLILVPFHLFVFFFNFSHSPDLYITLTSVLFRYFNSSPIS